MFCCHSILCISRPSRMRLFGRKQGRQIIPPLDLRSPSPSSGLRCQGTPSSIRDRGQRRMHPPAQPDTISAQGHIHMPCFLLSVICCVCAYVLVTTPQLAENKIDNSPILSPPSSHLPPHPLLHTAHSTPSPFHSPPSTKHTIKP